MMNDKMSVDDISIDVLIRYAYKNKVELGFMTVKELLYYDKHKQEMIDMIESRIVKGD